MLKFIQLSTLGLLLFFSSGLYAQNSLQYEDIGRFYRNGLELYERRNFASAVDEFKKYVDYSKNSIQKNEYDIVSAKYYMTVAALYDNAQDAEILVQRFIADHGDHPKASSIFADMGNYYFDRGNYADAIRYLEKAVDFNNNVESSYKLGISYYNIKNTNMALKFFNVVKKSNSEYRDEALYYAGVINFQNEKLEEAYQDLKQLENTTTYKNDIPNWLANILYKQKKYDELLTYTEAVLKNPNGRKLDDISILAAEMNYMRGNYQNAAKYYDMAKNFKKIFSQEVSFRHGYSQYITGNYKGSIENFKKIAAFETAAGQQGAYYLGVASQKSGDLLAAINAFDYARKQRFNPAIKEDAAFNYAKVLLQSGNNTEGVKALLEFNQSYGGSMYLDEVNELLSDAYLTSNDWDIALNYIESLRNKTPKIRDAYQKIAFNKAIEEYNNEQFKNALINFDKAINNGTDNTIKTTAKYWKGEAFINLKDINQAKSQYQTVVNESNDDLKFKAKYALGYISFGEKDFVKSIQIFDDFTKTVPRQDIFRPIYDDALLRIGDSYLAQKQYDNALKFYQTIIDNGKIEKDYALFQKGMISTFLDKNQEAKNSFDELARNYPASRYTVDAAYQNGILELEKGNYQSSINIFSKIVKEKPQTSLMPNVLLKRAVAYFNIQSHENAIKDYKSIIEVYPQSEVADEALIGLQDELTVVGRPEEFQQILAEYKRRNPESGTAVALEFESAKNLYTSEKYQQAIAALKNYVQNNPQTAQAAEAKFYIADSYYRLGDKQTGLTYFYQVISENKTNFVSRAAYRAGEIEFGNKNLKQAINNYQLVTKTSQNKREIVFSWSMLMDSYFQLSKFDSSIVFAKEVINAGNIINGMQNKGTLFLGKNFAAQGNQTAAMEEYRKLLSSNDVSGAEALFLFGELQYKQRLYKESIQTLQTFNTNFPDFISWKEKAFLLIADNYIALEDYFMAKATLESIAKYSNNPETVNVAKSKLSTIQDKN